MAIGDDVGWKIVFNGVQMNLRSLKMRDGALHIKTDPIPREYRLGFFIGTSFLFLLQWYFSSDK